MGKVAKLVAVSLLMRVIVEDTASKEEIQTAVGVRFIGKIHTGFDDYVEYIVDDTGCPYDPEKDETP